MLQLDDESLQREVEVSLYNEFHETYMENLRYIREQLANKEKEKL